MTPTDHRPYIKAAADHLTRAGLPVRSWMAERTPRTARIVIERDDDRVTLYWHEIRGWEYSDSTYDEDSPEGLDFAQLLDPPAIVLSSLLSESWTARRWLRDEVPDDEKSALAAYAPVVPEPTGPRPGQELAGRDGDTWTYVDIGAPELRLIASTRLHSSAWTREELEDDGPPLRPVQTVQLPERDASEVMSADEEQQLVDVLAEIDPAIRADRDGDRWACVDLPGAGPRWVMAADGLTREQLEDLWGPTRPAALNETEEAR